MHPTVDVTERRLEITADDGVTLVGELTFPERDPASSAALILNGSGPLDRDSNMPGQALDIANTLASALLALGVASLRFDKRGVGQSAGDYLTTSFDRETDDAAAALAALRRETELATERVVVIGHSVGATIAIRLAGGHRLAGVVLLSASVQRGADVMRWQSARIADSMGWTGRLRRGGLVRKQERVRQLLLETEGDVATIDGNEVPARWLREFMSYDPTRDLPEIRCPVLAVTGRKDVQVDADDVERIGGIVSGPFEGDTPPDLTHVLRLHGGRAGIDTYPAQLATPMDPALVERVASWVAAR